MERKQFTFYESFARAISRIKEKEARAEAYDAIVNYALYGIEPDLDAIPDVSAIAFELSRPNLDASRKKASSGKSGGSKKKANQKQTESKGGASKPEASGAQANRKQEQSESKKEKEKEVEVEIEEEIENKCLRISPPVGGDTRNPDVAAVLADYLDRINPSASPASLDELRGYAEVMGEAVCKRAFDVALDNKKATWPYIRAILRDKQARGVKCLADWNAQEEARSTDRSGKQAQAGKKDFNPSDEQIQKNNDWMDAFLAEQGVEL